MDSTNLISYVRAECGKVTSLTDLGDPDITREGGYVLDKIAECIPVKKLRSITSKANEREYDVHANTIRVQTVLPWGALETATDLWGSNIGQSSGTPDVSEYYNFPSLWTIDMIRKMKGLQRIKWEFHPIERKLKIDPMPTVAGDIYYYFSIEKADWTLAKLPADFESLLVTGTAWRCLEIIALARSRLGGVQRTGGFVDYPSDRLKPFIESKKDEFELGLEVKAKIYMP